MEHPVAERHGPPCLWSATPSVPMRRDTCAVGDRPLSDSPRLGDDPGVVDSVGRVSGLVVLATGDSFGRDVEREDGGWSAVHPRSLA